MRIRINDISQGILRPVFAVVACLLSFFSALGGDIDRVYEVDSLYYSISDIFTTETEPERKVAVLEHPSEGNRWLDIEYKGILNIPDSVEINGEKYIVASIGYCAFTGFEELTEVNLPKGLESIQDYAFEYTTSLRKLRVNNFTGFGSNRVFSMSGIKEFIVENTGLYDYDDWMAGPDGMQLDLLKVDRVHKLHISTCSEVKCADFAGADTVVIWNNHPFGVMFQNHPIDNLKYMIMRSTTPPAVIVKYDSRKPVYWNLGLTVLFVPDESVEAYKNSFVWKDFFSIHPLSELDRVDEFLSEVASVKEVTSGGDGYTISDGVLHLTGVGRRRVDIYSTTGLHLYGSECGEGASLTLPKGLNIVVVDGEANKVAIR